MDGYTKKMLYLDVRSFSKQHFRKKCGIPTSTSIDVCFLLRYLFRSCAKCKYNLKIMPVQVLYFNIYVTM